MTSCMVKIKQYCPRCLRPMVRNIYDSDVYLCFENHLDGKGVWIDLNPDKERKIEFPDHKQTHLDIF